MITSIIPIIILGICLIALVHSCNNTSFLIFEMTIIGFIIIVFWIMFQIVKSYYCYSNYFI